VTDGKEIRYHWTTHIHNDVIANDVTNCQQPTIADLLLYYYPVEKLNYQFYC